MSCDRPNRDSDPDRPAIVVDLEEQGSGIGSALFDHGSADLDRSGARTVHRSIRENDERARAFVEHRGFRPSSHGDRVSRLNVQSGRLTASRAAAKCVLRSGIRIVTLAEIGTEHDALRAIWEMETRTSYDMPGSVAWEGLDYSYWRRPVLDGAGGSVDTVWIALQGNQPIGIATLQISAGKSAENGYTGVDVAYRGRGIARALKLCTVEWAAEHGIEWIYTGNEVQYAPMLAINRELGYEPLPAFVEVVHGPAPE